MMAVRVLIVDDSSFYRKQLIAVLSADRHLKVVGEAENGHEAISMAADLKPDVITMDIEMPGMDGISAVKRIMDSTPCPILMLSSHTGEGAKSTFDALSAGATDFMLKFTGEDAKNENFKRTLCARLRILAAKGLGTKKLVDDPLLIPHGLCEPHSIGGAQVVLVGASTGGPIAIQEILKELPKNFDLPIVIIQHMPASFTEPFSQRLNEICALNVLHASDGMVIKKGNVYISPGGKQILFESDLKTIQLHIKDPDMDQVYQPCIDIALESYAKNASQIVPLVIILTGMGSDGTEGVKHIKSNTSVVWGQDEESSVIYGMPMSVYEAGYTDCVMSLNDITQSLMMGNK